MNERVEYFLTVFKASWDGRASTQEIFEESSGDYIWTLGVYYGVGPLEFRVGICAKKSGIAGKLVSYFWGGVFLYI